MTKGFTCPESLSIPGNIHFKICGLHKELKAENIIHNNCTPNGIQYILFCLTQGYTPVITNFGITTNVITYVEGEQIVTETERIFAPNATDENLRGGVIRDMVTTGSGLPRARFRFYLQTTQLVNEELLEIHLYGTDRSGGKFKMFSASHSIGSSSSYIKDDNTSIMYEWQIGLRNETESQV